MTALLVALYIAAQVCMVACVWVIVRALARIAESVRADECPRCQRAG